MTKEEIQDALLSAIRERDTLASRAQEIYRKAAEAEHGYELAKAKAFVNVDGAMELRKMQAVILTERESLNAKLADAEGAGVKDRLRAFESTISALQSLLRLEILDFESVKFNRSVQ